jgi:hypothetical protein
MKVHPPKEAAVTKEYQKDKKTRMECPAMA